MKKFLLSFMFVFAIPAVSYANSVETGKIERIIQSAGGVQVVQIWLTGDDDQSECAKGERWTIQKGVDIAFKEKLAMILLAYAQNKTVSFYHGTWQGCGIWDSRKIYYVDVWEYHQ